MRQHWCTSKSPGQHTNCRAFSLPHGKNILKSSNILSCSVPKWGYSMKTLDSTNQGCVSARLEQITAHPDGPWFRNTSLSHLLPLLETHSTPTLHCQDPNSNMMPAFNPETPPHQGAKPYHPSTQSNWHLPGWPNQRHIYGQRGRRAGLWQLI